MLVARPRLGLELPVCSMDCIPSISISLSPNIPLFKEGKGSTPVIARGRRRGRPCEPAIQRLQRLLVPGQEIEIAMELERWPHQISSHCWLIKWHSTRHSPTVSFHGRKVDPVLALWSEIAEVDVTRQALAKRLCPNARCINPSHHRYEPMAGECPEALLCRLYVDDGVSELTETLRKMPDLSREQLIADGHAPHVVDEALLLASRNP